MVIDVHNVFVSKAAQRTKLVVTVPVGIGESPPGRGFYRYTVRYRSYNKTLTWSTKVHPLHRSNHGGRRRIVAVRTSDGWWARIATAAATIAHDEET
jgi:hypothetical protein